MSDETRVRGLLRQQAAIAEFGSFALRQHDLQLVLAEAARFCAEGIDAPFCKICRYRSEENDLLIEAGWGWQDGVVGYVVSRADASSPQGRSFTTGQPSVHQDLSAEASFTLPPFYAAHRIVSTVDVIIKTDAVPYGVLEIDSDVRHAYDEHDIDFLTAFANVLSEAVATAARVSALENSVDSMRQVVSSLGKSEQRFRSLLEAAPNAVVVIAAKGRIEMVNAETERMFGYSRSELVGRNVDMLVPDRFRRPLAGAPYALAPPPQEPWPWPSTETGVNFYCLRQDGQEIRAEIDWTLIDTDDGTMAISTIVDLTSRMQLEAQLRQAQKMEAVGRLTAGVAHDFNNILQVVMSGMETLLAEVEEQSPIRELAELALHAANHGAQMTHRLLAFSRQQVLAPRVVPVRKLFEDVAALVSRPFSPSVEVTILPLDEDLAVLADVDQLEAAILNLAVNSRDALTEGGRITFSGYARRLTARLAPGMYTVIVVVDNGIGMDAATLAQACDPFFTTKGLKGSGLGLSMVQGFVRQSGGEVLIDSEPGGGTRVELWLPAAAPVKLEPPQMPMASAACSGHILLVDDEAGVLATVGAMLRQAGFSVTQVDGADRALAQLESGAHFDLVVADLAMPGRSGSVLLKAARRVNRTLPQLMITGTHADDQDDPEGCLILRKPFNKSDLLARVRALMSTGQ